MLYCGFKAHYMLESNKTMCSYHYLLRMNYYINYPEILRNPTYQTVIEDFLEEF